MVAEIGARDVILMWKVVGSSVEIKVLVVSNLLRCATWSLVQHVMLWGCGHWVLRQVRLFVFRMLIINNE